MKDMSWDEEKLWRCWARVTGFSFTAKQWGEFDVEQLEEVEFDDTAYDRLVIPDNQKRLIKALVENCDGTFTDIIEGKVFYCTIKRWPK